MNINADVLRVIKPYLDELGSRIAALETAVKALETAVKALEDAAKGS